MAGQGQLSRHLAFHLLIQFMPCHLTFGQPLPFARVTGLYVGAVKRDQGSPARGLALDMDVCAIGIGVSIGAQCTIALSIDMFARD